MRSDIVKRLRLAWKLMDDDRQAVEVKGADEIERLRARVAELEGQLEAEEMQSDMFVRRGDAYHERLMAVVAVANERDWADPVIRAFCQRIMTAAGFERCECGGSGELLVNTIEPYQAPVRNPCPCVANGTTGWREQ